MKLQARGTVSQGGRSGNVPQIFEGYSSEGHCSCNGQAYLEDHGLFIPSIDIKNAGRRPARYQRHLKAISMI